MRPLALVLALLVAGLLPRTPHGTAADPPRLPEVVLIGDSIRLGDAPTVTKQLAGKAVVVGPAAKGGDGANVLKNLAQWAVAEQPDVVHFHSGIHDTKKDKHSGRFQVPPEQYESNLRQIVQTLRMETQAVVLFAVTPPILDDRAAALRKTAPYELLDAGTQERNRIARKVMQDLNVPVDDLRALLGEGDDRARLMSPDGVHLTAEGSKRLGETVADFVAKHLPTTKE